MIDIEQKDLNMTSFCRNIDAEFWPALEKLVKESHVDVDTFHLTDDRVTANGFNVKCHIGK